MYNNKIILIIYIFSLFLLTTLSCDTNNSSNAEENNLESKEEVIYKNQEEAKLLVSTAKNYINLISYNNYIKTKDLVSAETKLLLDSVNTKITKSLHNLKELSRDEFILIPDKNDVLLFDDKLFTEDKIEEGEDKYLIKLSNMLDKQIELMNEIGMKSKNSAINKLANESEDFLEEHKLSVNNIIDKH